MRLPLFGNNSRLSAAVPALTAGLDVSRPACRIADNALSDADGVWWQNGALCTRPGFRTTATRRGWVGENTPVRFYTDREGYRIALTAETYAGEEAAVTAIGVEIFDSEGVATGRGWTREFSAGTRAFCVPAGGSTPEYTTLVFFSSGVIMGLHPRLGVYEDITHRPYLPLLMVNGAPVATRADSTVNGVLYESRNRLTERFRCHFTSDGTGVYYYLPVGNLWGDVIVTVCRDNGNAVYTVSTNADSSDTAGGLRVKVDRAAGCLWFVSEAGTPAVLTDSGRRNNVQVEAGAPTQGVTPFDMAFGVWYGGDRSGAAGGTRLFLGGSTAAPAVTVWSALDDPLYFPHSSYAVVGTPGSPLTAFGKQGGLLVLFKEREIYTAEYVAGEEVDAADLESGRVTDVTAAAATFPLTPLHTEIGCDLPDTVALPGNRLVWACADGTVYALSSVSALNQHCVTRLSDKVQPLLRQTGAPHTAAATACDGRYWLLWDDCLLVAQGEDDPVWHRFSWPQNGTYPVGITHAGRTPYIPALHEVGGGSALYWFSADGDADTTVSHTGSNWAEAVYTLTEQPVRGMLCTKAYDMGEPERYKSVLGIAAEVTAVSAVTPSYVTERGEQYDRPVTPAPDGLLRLTPHLTRCRQLALRLTGEGLCVGSVTVHLRGGMR